MMQQYEIHCNVSKWWHLQLVHAAMCSGACPGQMQAPTKAIMQVHGTMMQPAAALGALSLGAALTCAASTGSDTSILDTTNDDRR